MPKAVPARGRRTCPPLVGASGGKPAATGYNYITQAEACGYH